MTILDKASVQKFGPVLLEWSNKPNAMLQLKRCGEAEWFDVAHIRDLSIMDSLRIKPDPKYRPYQYHNDSHFLKNLLGSKVFNKKLLSYLPERRHIERIEFYGKTGVIFNTNELYVVSYEDLLENYLFEDEKPCGYLVLE
jgi:hypothetical protein